MKPMRRWIVPRSSDSRIVKVASTSGMRSTMPKPASTSCCLTASMTVARPMVTVPFSIVTAPSFSPVSAATSCSWASRLASIHACSNASDRTKVWT